MKKRWIGILSLLLCVLLLASCTRPGETEQPEATGSPQAPQATGTPLPPSATGAPVEGARQIVLSGSTASLDGDELETFDYTWHCDPSTVHDEVKNAPAEYYTGTKPETDAAAYIDSELYYFPSLPESGFKKVNYDGEQEWAYYYTDGENNDFIFATLPALGNSFPTQMMHTPEEAAANKVLHITKPGTYALSGQWNGQIKVDLGEDAFTDPEAKVTVYLNGVNVTCTVAPGIIFENVYECDNTWEDRETYSADVNTDNAGVTVVIADDSINTVTGTNVFRMLKTKYKDETSTEQIKTQKKKRKTDGAFYSYVTMNVTGGSKNNGILTVNAGFEGIDSELHLAFLGGKIIVNSQDDGINVNEDNVSVVKFVGADLTINAAQGAEGDGVDSNGFIVVSGGTVAVNGVRVPDNALDSEDGVTYLGGRIVVDGTEQQLTPGTVTREIGGGRGQDPGAFGGDFDLAEFKKKVAELPDDATLADVLALLGMNDPGMQGNPGQQNDPGRQREPGQQGGDRPGGPGETPPARPDGPMMPGN